MNISPFSFCGAYRRGLFTLCNYLDGFYKIQGLQDVCSSLLSLLNDINFQCRWNVVGQITYQGREQRSVKHPQVNQHFNLQN